MAELIGTLPPFGLVRLRKRVQRRRQAAESSRLAVWPFSRILVDDERGAAARWQGRERTLADTRACIILIQLSQGFETTTRPLANPGTKANCHGTLEIETSVFHS